MTAETSNARGEWVLRLTALDGLVDRIAEAIRDGAGLAEGDPPWERLGEERRAPWRADAKRALSVVKESLTAAGILAARTSQPPDAEVRALPAKWRDRAANNPGSFAAAANVVCADDLEAALAAEGVQAGEVSAYDLAVLDDAAETLDRIGEGSAGLREARARIASALAQQPAAVGEEIMVNAAHDVYTLPLQPSGLLSGPRFVVHVPAPEQQPAAVDEARSGSSIMDGAVSFVEALTTQHQEPKS